MSATIDAAPETISQRSARATREFCEALGLAGVKPSDLPLLTVALAEVATKEARIDTSFAARVREAFQDVAASVASRPKPDKKVAKQNPFADLTPIGPIDLTRLRPHGPMDPYALIEAYGSAQTEQFLSNLSLESLKRSAEIVEERNPGTRPANRRVKTALLAYIMDHVSQVRSGR